MTEEHLERKENNSQQNSRNNHQAEDKKKNSDAKSDDEIIQENLKEILEKKSREERKANGRLVAVIVAFLVIFLAVYHAWIRKKAALAGVIVPAVIMLSYGGWVALLAKREKQRRALFERHLEEVALKNKLELEEKIKSKHKKPANRNNNTTDSNQTTLHYENEIDLKDTTKNQPKDKAENKSVIEQKKHHRKHHRQRRSEASSNTSGNCSSSSSSSRQSSSHHATKDLRSKRPSIRQKLFRQNAATTIVATPTIKISTSATSSSQAKKYKLQRLDAMTEPQLVRMGSAP